MGELYSSSIGEVNMVKARTAIFCGCMSFALGMALMALALLPRAQKAESRLEAIRTSIRDGAYPRPINCASYVGYSWSGHVLLKDWPDGEPQPEVCHLKPEVERLGLVPKDTP